MYRKVNLSRIFQDYYAISRKFSKENGLKPLRLTHFFKI